MSACGPAGAITTICCTCRSGKKWRNETGSIEHGAALGHSGLPADQSRARGTGGSGLGLAICREVLAVLGGSIRIAASSGEGTTFEIRLPGRVASSRLISEPLVESTAAHVEEPSLSIGQRPTVSKRSNPNT